MQMGRHYHQLTLAEVCEAIDQGRLATSVECGGYYVIRERDIALLLGSALPRTRRSTRPRRKAPACYN